MRQVTWRVAICNIAICRSRKSGGGDVPTQGSPRHAFDPNALQARRQQSLRRHLRRSRPLGRMDIAGGALATQMAMGSAAALTVEAMT
jgi:hypothetical protein